MQDGCVNSLRTGVVATLATATRLVHEKPTRALWAEPSVLPGLTIGGLVAHLVRGAGAITAFLDRSPEGGTGPLVDAAAYYDHATSAPVGQRIVDRSEAEAAAGYDAIVGELDALGPRLASRLDAEPADRSMDARGRTLTLDDFCRTRLVELSVHIADLALGIGRPVPELPAGVADQVMHLLLTLARRRYGDAAVIDALTRRERAGTVFPVL
jgi:uncharacterized protein (TIGR03083 family)